MKGDRKIIGYYMVAENLKSLLKNGNIIFSSKA
jgi:hypothetical protein